MLARCQPPLTMHSNCYNSPAILSADHLLLCSMHASDLPYYLLLSCVAFLVDLWFAARLGSYAAIDRDNSELFYLFVRAVTQKRLRICPTLVRSDTFCVL